MLVHAEPDRHTGRLEHADRLLPRSIRADRVDAETDAEAVGQLHHGVVEIFWGDDRVCGGPEARATALVDLADHDRARAGSPKHLGGEDADRSRAEHDRNVREAVGDEAKRMHARRERLAEDGDVRREAGGDRVDAAQGHGHELGEAAGAGASDQISPGADVLAPGAARGTLSARHLWVDRDPRSEEMLARKPSRRDHLAAELVPHDQRRRAARTAGGDPVQIRAADAGRLDPHDDLVVTGPRARDLTNLELVGGQVQQRLHGLGHALLASRLRPLIQNIRSS